MDTQLLIHLCTNQELFDLYGAKLNGRLRGKEILFWDWAIDFLREKNRLPTDPELRLKFRDFELPPKEELDVSLLKQSFEEELFRDGIIDIADSLDKHLLAEARVKLDKLKEEFLKETPQLELPLSLSDFLKQDILPLQYWVKDILQKEGRTMLSSSMNVGKSFLLQQLALAVSSGQPTFLDKFSITQGRVLYLDCEMGASALKDRFSKMAYNLDTSNLFIQYLPTLDLVNPEDRQNLEHWLSDLKIDILIIDPLGNAWHGDENKAQDVSLVTSYLDEIREKYKVAILLSHHWKKKSRDLKRGFEMASGSYRWSAWLDCHITLEGNIDNVTVSCEKSRNSARFSPFMIKFNEETLTFGFLADFEKRYNEETLVNLFAQADINNAGKVAVSDLKKLAGGKPSARTIDKLIAESSIFEIERHGGGKKSYLKRKDTTESNDLFKGM